MSNLASKFGGFLSHPADKNSGQTQEQIHTFHQYSFANPEKRRPSNGGYGADTSSVTSFLLAILSSSNTKYPRCSHTPEAPEEVLCSRHDDDNKEQDPNMCCKLSCESLQGAKHEYESNDPINMSNQLGNLKEYPSHVALKPAPTTPLKPPPLLDESSLLSEDFRAFISLALPTIARDRHWIMLYSTAKHGTSMRTLYQKCSMLSEPFLLVIGDLEGAIFGGLATAPLKPTAQRKYSGTRDTFVFTNVREDPQLFKTTGANRYYLLCTNDAISFGGGGHFALHLDDTLLTGSSGACDTFGNDCLATSLDFSVSDVEVWGFTHGIRHT